MTTEETARILEVVRLLWPHSKLGDDPASVLVVWQAMLGRFDHADVEQTIRELAASGRDHAPLVGQIVKTLIGRAADAPDWDEAWAEIQRLVSRRGRNWRPEPEAFSHPLTYAFACPAWKELCLGPAEGTRDYGTHYAQQREAFKALAARTQRDAGLVAIGAPRRTSLRRLKPLAALPYERPELEAS